MSLPDKIVAHLTGERPLAHEIARIGMPGLHGLGHWTSVERLDGVSVDYTIDTAGRHYGHYIGFITMEHFPGSRWLIIKAHVEKNSYGWNFEREYTLPKGRGMNVVIPNNLRAAIVNMTSIFHDLRREPDVPWEVVLGRLVKAQEAFERIR